MKWKSTAVLFLVTVAVGAYVSLYELRQPPPEERRRREREILSIPSDSVTRIVLEMPQGTSALVRAGGDWRLEPNGLRADPQRMERILFATQSLIAERVLTGTEAQPLRLTDFGLDPPAGRLALTVSGGAGTTLWFGDAVPLSANRYLRIEGRPEVFIIPGLLFADADHPPQALRDPLLLRLKPWLVEGLALQSGTDTVALARQDGVWTITHPISDVADRLEAERLVPRLGGISIRRFLAEAGSADEAAWGFDAPLARVVVLQGQEGPSLEIVFGRSVPDAPDLLYAVRTDEPSVYAVSSEDAAALVRDPASVRERRCFDAVVGEIAKVELAPPEGGAAWIISRSDPDISQRAKGGGMTQPEWRDAGSGQPLNGTRVQDWLGGLVELRVAGFVDEDPLDLSRYGLAPGSSGGAPGSIAVWTRGRDAPQRLWIGAREALTGARYGRIEGRRPVVRLPETCDALLAMTPESLAPHRGPPAPADATPAAP